jgi:hypothetical protein
MGSTELETDYTKSYLRGYQRRKNLDEVEKMRNAKTRIKCVQLHDLY